MSRTGWLFIAVMLVVLLEGALRKWVSPSLTMPLVALRDALALYTIWYTARLGLMPVKALPTRLLTAWSCVVIAWGLWQTLWLQTPPLVLAVGLRFWLLYFWFGYAAAMGMTREDYRRAALVLLYVLIASTPLIVLQHNSPPGAFINTQLDTEEADIFVVILGVVRPTGTFSFTLGYTTLLALAFPVAVLWPGIGPATRKSRLVFLLAFASLLVGSVLSGSRSAIIGYGIMLAAYLLGAIWFSRGARKLYAVIALAFSGLLLVSVLAAFPGAILAMQQRFQAAAEAENFVARVLSIFAGEPEIYARLSWLGHGLGTGSNLAGYFQAGERIFALAESEPARILLEGGWLGGLFTLLKLCVLAAGLVAAWRVAQRSFSPAPMVAWLALLIALPTWSAIGQLTVNAMLGLLIAFVVLALRFPALSRAPVRPAPAGRPLPGVRPGMRPGVRPRDPRLAQP